ncbi:phosphoribosyltransferase [Azospirillum sp. RWY-5-1]|uniref:Phosphoribosyltransferase n=1 Tax=Azospirillum oleiclasticum TaxID=2735135 RepID=A0ABX2TKA1_9PROT|nr:phosphoribosyltransferase [Azospirillum oleiclasticum]NYZ17402.1 phosphoribosyltransferase [Azospirillum oleiclasticum]NYZ24779.1 phosphoribosyltransferase [Azospirillum oleiclasticum]
MTIDQPDPHFTEPTHGYWQTLEPPGMDPARRRPPFRYGYPVELPDGRFLVLPIRRRPDPERAAASLIPNHASFAVIDALAGFMAELARPLAPDVVVGLPTLGLALAPELARRLGHTRYAPLGYSRKVWYREELSQPVRSITSPDATKRVWLDPNLLPWLAGKRVVLVDDTVSSGTTAAAVLRLFAAAGVTVAGVVAAMSQGGAWRDHLAAEDPAWPGLVRWVFETPLFRRVEEGWEPIGHP